MTTSVTFYYAAILEILFSKHHLICSLCQVRISAMQIRSTPRELLAGDPLCAPGATAVAESLVLLLRRLFSYSSWTPHISTKMCSILDAASAWHAAKNKGMSVIGQKTKDPISTVPGDLDFFILFLLLFTLTECLCDHDRLLC